MASPPVATDSRPNTERVEYGEPIQARGEPFHIVAPAFVLRFVLKNPGGKARAQTSDQRVR
jgi:hypothetical protein